MEMDLIKKHWTTLAQRYGEDIQATTKTETIKKLEINVFERWLRKLGFPDMEVLEVGCGNGINCIELAKRFGEGRFTGVDYVEDMVKNAEKKALDVDNANFYVDDVLKLDSEFIMEKKFDFILTDRCLINLNQIELQKKALFEMSQKISAGGFLLMLENSEISYEKQNNCREIVGLTRRTPAEYNLFINDTIILDYLQNELKYDLVAIDNFASLHDIFLYIINPMHNNDTIDYNDNSIQMITDFLIALDDAGVNQFGEFGQNRLYIMRKTTL